MRRSFKKVLAVLDGTPTGMRGQSLVELSLTLPIFLIMLVGLSEVGWYANNLLILTDVVRAAGRFGSIRDPLEWVPGTEKEYHRIDCDVLGSVIPGATHFNVTGFEDPPLTSPPVTLPGFTNGTETQDLGYYDGVACTAIANMAPLEFKNAEDDIIVSVFSYATLPDCGTGSSCIRVTGRYPRRQNECADDEYDPFDFNHNRQVDEDLGEDPADIDGPGFAFNSEGFRGYVFRGNHIPAGDPACRGSEFSTAWMEEQLNRTVTDTDLTQGLDAVELGLLPNNGLILVEIDWKSYQLLGLPFFTWVGNPIVVHIWGIFPVSAAEPNFE